jgi:hypothetical protein
MVIVMKVEKKLIAFFILALTIGVSSVTPILLLIPREAKAQTTVDKPWFNVTALYSYIEAGNGSLSSSLGSANFTLQNVNDSDFEYDRSYTILNFTLKTDLKKEPNDRSEYYLMQIYSDKQSIKNTTFAVGTYGSFFKPEERFAPGSFQFNRTNWFDSNTTGAGSWMPHNYTLHSTIWAKGHSGSGPTGDSSSSKLASAIKQADTIFITVRRLGWITFSENSTVVTRSDEIVAQMQLDKFGKGFLYNAFIPTDKLSQIDPNLPATMDPITGQYIPNIKP